MNGLHNMLNGDFMDEIDREKLNQIMAEYADFFEVDDVPEPRVGFVYSREDFDKLLGRKTERWERAVSRQNGLFFIHSSKIEELTPHTNADFWPVVKHEMSHWFYRHVTGVENGNPRWFNEGLAGVVAEQRRTQKPAALDEPVVDKYYSYSDASNYAWGYWMVKYLLDEFGKEKLVALIKSLAGEEMTKNFFAAQFEKAYHFDVTDLQDRALAVIIDK